MSEFVAALRSAQERATLPISALGDVCIPDLDSAMHRLSELVRTMNPVEVYTPANAKSAQEVFLQDFKAGNKASNPIFTYDEAELRRISSMRVPLENLLQASCFSASTDAEKLLVQLFRDKVEDALLTTKIARGILARNDGATGEALIAKYGLASDALFKEALAAHEAEKTQRPDTSVDSDSLLSSIMLKLRHANYRALGIKYYFERALDLYGFGDLWEVIISDKARAIDVRDKSEYGYPVIVVPRDRVVSGQKLMELIGHEVECHVRQSMNGIKLLHGLGGGVLKDDDETLYEGLAKISDIDTAYRYFGEVVATPSPYYIIAAEYAHRGATFRKVFAKLYEMMRDIGRGEDAAMKSAWTATYRVFRGSTDPANLSCFVQPKDKAYFEGYQIAREMVDSGLGHLLDVGAINPATLLRVAEFRISEEDIPSRNINAAVRVLA